MIYFLKIIKFIEKKIHQKIFGGFWSNFQSETKIENCKIIIDLSNEKVTHFGDNLFFISAFINKDVENFQFLISDKYRFLWEKFDIENITTEINLKNKKIVYVSSFESAKLNYKTSKNFSKKILFDFTDSTIDNPLYKHISDFFNLKKISKENNITKNQNNHLDEIDLNKITKKKFFIYNDIIYSRTFLRKKLSSKLKKYIDKEIEENLSIYFIGSEQDKKFYNYNNRLIDIRGTINFNQIISLILHENCLGFIGLDNGLMHLNLLLNRKARILFRGKFSKNQSNHHYRCINIAMNKNAKNNIKYIK